MNPEKAQALAIQIREVILTDFQQLFDSENSVIGKSILIASGIEFLGACLDRQHLKASARSEKRFNLAIQKLFPAKYHSYVRKESIPNLYLDFRCPVIHQFRIDKSICVTSGDTNRITEPAHLSYQEDGRLVINIREFSNDLQSAASALINKLTG